MTEVEDGVNATASAPAPNLPPAIALVVADLLPQYVSIKRGVR